MFSITFLPVLIEYRDYIGYTRAIVVERSFYSQLLLHNTSLRDYEHGGATSPSVWCFQAEVLTRVYETFYQENKNI